MKKTYISTGVLSGLVNWLSSECQLKAKVAEVGEFPAPGTVYFALEKCDLELDMRGNFIYSNCPTEGKHFPFITVMFKSLARFDGTATAGVFDGAEGF